MILPPAAALPRSIGKTVLYLALDGYWHGLGDRMEDGLTYTLCGGALYRQRMPLEATFALKILGMCVACSTAIRELERSSS